MNTSTPEATAGRRGFDAQAFLDSSRAARKIVEFEKREIIFSQGDPCESILYIQEGRVKLSVVNAAGKEAVVAMLGPGDFLGEGCMAGQSARMETATALMPASLLVIEKDEMTHMLRKEHRFSDCFIQYTLGRYIRIEEDLIDQLFNSSEKRLARALLLLAPGAQDQPRKVVPKVSQEVLADMIGTTRSRVSFFMNKFKKLGFIEYDDGLKVNSALLTVVLAD